MQEKDFIKQRILAMATERGTDKTICPSEVARALYPREWRQHMKTIRETALALEKQGKVWITQKGTPIKVDHVDQIEGPIRIKIR